ncbi:MAG: glycosyltransferase [Bdellovibrionota bacterium]
MIGSALPISIILPVYNGALYLKESIDSILNQEYENFELIIIDDGSKDNSWEIIESCAKNPKIKAHKQANHGLAATLNTGISLAKYDYIARQDQDDISLPGRLKAQMLFLLNNPTVDLVGTWAQVIEEDKLVDRYLKHEIEDKKIKTFLLFDTPFVHTSVLFKKKVAMDVGLYATDLNVQPPEDYEFWTRFALKHELANIPEILIHYREVKTSMSRQIGNTFAKNMIAAGSIYAGLITQEKESPSVLTQIYQKVPLTSRIYPLGIFLKYKKFWEKTNKENFDFSCSVARYHLKTLFKNYIKLKLLSKQS